MRTRRWSRRKRLMLVTGASGFLGRHLTNTEASDGWEIYAPSSTALDVRNRELVDDEITGWQPNAVVHLAYRKDDRRSIVQGSANVARAAAAAGARLVHVSTDVVFGGRAAPYVETDELAPFGDYGTWKAEAERAVAELAADSVIVRTSLMYGTANLAVIQRDVDDVLSGRSSMRFFTDEWRCPVHAIDVATAIARIADRHDVRGVLHVAGPEAITRADLARRFATWLGHDPARVPTATIAESGMQRAGRIVLDTSRAAALGLRCRTVDEVLRPS